MSDEEKPEQGSPLAAQLGSDAKKLGAGNVQMSRFSNLGTEDEVNLVLLLYADMRGRTNRRWKLTYDFLLNHSVSLGGLGRKQAIKTIAVEKGGSVREDEEPKKPGILARNLWNRDWEDKERERIEKSDSA